MIKNQYEESELCKSQLIADDLREKINNKELSGKLQPIHGLAVDYQVNFKTVNKAVNILVTEGLLNSRRGRGTFVVPESSQSQNNRLIAIFMPIRGHVYSELHNTLVSELRKYNYFPVVIDNSSLEAPEKEIDRIIQLSPEAIIVDRVSDSFPCEYLKQKEDKIKHLIFFQTLESHVQFNADYVLSDTFYGSYIGTKHLLDLGHKRILFIIHKSMHSPLHYRYTDHYQYTEGYRLALREKGLENNAQYHFETMDYNAEVKRFKKLMQSRNRPTAIFGAADIRAIRALRALKKIGLAVPDDVAVVGYYNTPWCEFSEVPLTSVSIKGEEMAGLTVQCILNNRTDNKRMLVKPELIIRESSGNKLSKQKIAV